jgi:hypothetical protein
VEEDNTLWDRRAAKKKLIFHESSLDIPAMENAGDPIFRFGRGGDMNQYEDQDSEVSTEIKREIYYLYKLRPNWPSTKSRPPSLGKTMRLKILKKC